MAQYSLKLLPSAIIFLISVTTFHVAGQKSAQLTLDPGSEVLFSTVVIVTCRIKQFDADFEQIELEFGAGNYRAKLFGVLLFFPTSSVYRQLPPGSCVNFFNPNVTFCTTNSQLSVEFVASPELGGRASCRVIGRTVVEPAVKELKFSDIVIRITPPEPTAGQRVEVSCMFHLSGEATETRMTELEDWGQQQDTVTEGPPRSQWRRVSRVVTPADDGRTVTCLMGAKNVSKTLYIRTEGRPFTHYEFNKLKSLVRRPRTQWVGSVLIAADEGAAGDASRYERRLDGQVNRTRFFSRARIQQGGIKSPGYPKVSSDLEVLLVTTARHFGFRHSFKATYKVVQSNAAASFRAADVLPTPDTDPKAALLQCATWSPSNHSLAFVFEKNIYFTSDPFNRSKTRSLTSGLPQGESVFYGISDWLYEEDVIHKSAAMWFSPQGTHLAFLSFNDTALPRYRMTWFGDPGQLYVGLKPIVYPKAGDDPPAPSPDVKLHVATNIGDAASSVLSVFQPPTGLSTDHYIVFVRWYDEERLLVGWADRPQTTGWVTLCNITTVTCRTVWKKTIASGWVHILKESYNEPIPDKANNRFFMIDIHSNGFMQLAEVKTSGNLNSIRWLTNGRFDINDILRHSGNSIYFVAAHPTPTQRNIYKLDLASGTNSCMTCLDPQCSYNSGSFSKDGAVFVQNCGGPGLPKTLLRTTSDANFTILKTISEHKAAADFMTNKTIARVVYKEMTLRPGTRDEMTVHAQFTYPSGLREEHNVKYPLLLFVYAGPTINVVKESFYLRFERYLAQALNIVVASVDGRGTPNRGTAYHHAIKYRIGDVEVQDQMDFVKEVAKLQFIDSTRVAAFGGSYGGFTVINLLAHPDNKNLIRCGVAHAPVTNFRYYDTAYTERYIGLYRDHKDAYERTNLISKAKKVAGKRLLLSHGTGDDNVHFSNSAQLVKAMIKEYIDFDVMYYPDDNHWLYSSRSYFDRKWAIFLRDCLNKTSHRWRMEL